MTAVVATHGSVSPRGLTYRTFKQVASSTNSPSMTLYVDHPWENAMSPPAEESARWADEACSTRNVSAVPRLIELLDHHDDDVVAAAADALGHIGAPSATSWPSLVVVLASKRRPYWVRDTAAYALGSLGVVNDAVVGALRDATGDVESSVARCARESLTALGT